MPETEKRISRETFPPKEPGKSEGDQFSGEKEDPVAAGTPEGSESFSGSISAEKERLDFPPAPRPVEGRAPSVFSTPLDDGLRTRIHEAGKNGGMSPHKGQTVEDLLEKIFKETKKLDE